MGHVYFRIYRRNDHCDCVNPGQQLASPPMCYHLRTLMLVITAVCLFCGWYAHLRRMAAHHRAKAAEEDATYIQLISQHPGVVLRVYWDGPGSPVSHHSKGARDFDHALLRPWLAFVHCKPGSIFGAPIQPLLPAPIVKRLAARDSDPQQDDY
jgi:hypothetical protein